MVRPSRAANFPPPLHQPFFLPSHNYDGNAHNSQLLFHLRIFEAKFCFFLRSSGLPAGTRLHVPAAATARNAWQRRLFLAHATGGAFRFHFTLRGPSARESNKTNRESMAPAGGRVCNLCVLNAAPVAQLNPAYSYNKFWHIFGRQAVVSERAKNMFKMRVFR